MPKLPIRQRFQNLDRLWHEAGSKETLAQLWAEFGRLMARHPRRFVTPDLQELYEHAISTHLSPSDLLSSSPVAGRWGSMQRAISQEFSELTEEIEKRYEARSLRFERWWGVETNTSFLLYALARLIRPELVVETGVANGHSSFYLLAAIRRNRCGRLCSVDVSEDVGGLLDNSDYTNWSLRVLDRRHLRSSLKSAMEDLDQIDLFVHDSDHSYRWQKTEFDLAFAKMSASGIIAADDAGVCYAFHDFCRKTGRLPHLLVDTRKVFGLSFMSQKQMG